MLKEKKFNEFERLIETNKDIVNNMTYENHYEPTMLIHAVEYNKDNSIVEYLSKLECCDVTIPDHLGQTAFHFSACNGNIEAMEYLLQRDCSILNHCVFQYTALHTAACSGNLEMTKFLLKQPNIDVDIRDYHGKTPDRQGKVDKEIVDLIRQHRKEMQVKMKKVQNILNDCVFTSQCVPLFCKGGSEFELLIKLSKKGGGNSVQFFCCSKLLWS